MTTANDILSTSIEIIQDPGNWTQGCLARNERGEETSLQMNQDTNDIKSVCVIGALRLAANRLGSRWFQSEKDTPYEEAANRLVNVPEIAQYKTDMHPIPIAKFNDLESTTHEDVILVLKKALHDTE